MTGQGCRRICCRRCGDRERSLRRRWLREELSTWSRHVFLTLTVDGNGTKTGRGFADPGAAYDEVRDKRYVSALMKKLGVRRYVKVLECQNVGSGGWPHWHLVLDGRVDIRVVRYWWCEVWRIGWQVNISESQAPEALGGYLAGYLAKVGPDLPQWVRNRSRIRWVEAGGETVGYRQWLDELSGRVSLASHIESDDVLVAGESRSIGEAVDGCHRESVILRPVVSDSGRQWWCYEGHLSVSVRTLRRLCDRLGLAYELEFVWKVFGWLKETELDDQGRERVSLVRDLEGTPMWESQKIAGVRGIWLGPAELDRVLLALGLRMDQRRGLVRRDSCKDQARLGDGGGGTHQACSLPPGCRIEQGDSRVAESNCHSGLSSGSPPPSGSQTVSIPARGMPNKTPLRSGKERQEHCF